MFCYFEKHSQPSLLSGLLNSVKNSSHIVEKSGKKKILRHDGINYLLEKSKKQSYFELSNEKYSTRILGSMNNFLDSES